ncbi:motilin-like isoform X2 [Synchiropus splendidus]|uniref:motilin-like isoform X2 n=1 Tax=Synchiropus splendidus TaxID=270530 RepID=UPI00237E6CFA|nr:motilin-like isoform X2 [Synchiropus splendidus]
MSMRGVLAMCVVLTCLVATMVERTEGHITFFSPKEIMQMQLKEREGQKNMEARSEEGPFEEATVQHLPQDETVEIAVRLSPQQLDHVAPVLEEIIHQIAGENRKAK